MAISLLQLLCQQFGQYPTIAVLTLVFKLADQPCGTALVTPCCDNSLKVRCFFEASAAQGSVVGGQGQGAAVAVRPQYWQFFLAGGAQVEWALARGAAEQA